MLPAAVEKSPSDCTERTRLRAVAECTIVLQWLVLPLPLPWLEHAPQAASNHPQRNTVARETAEGLLYSVAVQSGGGVVAAVWPATPTPGRDRRVQSAPVAEGLWRYPWSCQGEQGGPGDNHQEL